MAKILITVQSYPNLIDVIGYIEHIQDGALWLQKHFEEEINQLEDWLKIDGNKDAFLHVYGFLKSEFRVRPAQWA